MIIIPAIDIKNGRCVRLLQGRMDSETVFSNDPSEMAKRWEDEGAEIIHVVDLDGAVEKHPQNTNSILKILETVDVPVQVGGGIRTRETVRFSCMSLARERSIPPREQASRMPGPERSPGKGPGNLGLRRLTAVAIFRERSYAPRHFPWGDPPGRLCGFHHASTAPSASNAIHSVK